MNQNVKAIELNYLFHIIQLQNRVTIQWKFAKPDNAFGREISEYCIN